MRKSGVYQVLTPDECVALAEAQGGIILHPLMGGIPAKLGWQSLELFKTQGAAEAPPGGVVSRSEPIPRRDRSIACFPFAAWQSRRHGLRPLPA